MNSNFIDLKEIKKPININLDSNKSKIDSIEIINKKEHYLDDVFSKDKTYKKDMEYEDKGKKEKDKKDINDNKDYKNNKLIDQENIEEQDTGIKRPGLKEKAENIKNEKVRKKDNIEKQFDRVDIQDVNDVNLKNNDIDVLGELEEAEELTEETEEESNDEINRLTEEAYEGQNVIVNPEDVSLISIDKNLLNPDLSIENGEDQENISEEKFGVNRARIFYNIDKEIYSTRSTSIFSKSKLKSIKKGILFPASMASAIFFVSFIVIIIMLLFFRSVSASSLEDNIIKDESILAKIAKQMDEERKLAALKLEEERRKLEEDRKRLKSAINEELLKKEADIENRYLQKLKELERGGITVEEKKQLEKEKEEALINARQERDNKIEEQDRLLAEKDAKIKMVMDNLKEESKNYEQEIIRIKNEYEEKRREEERRVEIANQKLNELKAIDEKVAKFNSFIYQLISGAMSEYKSGKIDSAIQSLNSVLKYYNSNLDFVLAHNELKNKMNTDVFFVEAIGGLIENSEKSILNNKEYKQILSKFNKVITFYNRAESYNNDGKYEKSSKEYMKVLKEFDEINDSYTKLNNAEKKIQDSLANNYLSNAKELIGENKYQEALDKLYLIIEKAPLSDIKDLALEEIIKVNEILSIDSKINTDNENAKKIFDQAEGYKKAKDYDSAKKLYDQIVLNYPLSDYTKKALEESKYIDSILNPKKEGFDDYKNELKENFLEHYQKYQYYSNMGDFERARIYYFEALKNSFDSYTDSSIINFKKEEDRYIEDLIKENLRNKDQYIEYLIEEYNVKIKKIEEEYKQLKDKYEELERKYNDNIISKKEREKTENEIEDYINKKYIMLKKEKINEEREKVKNEFIGELYKIKKSIKNNYNG